MSSSSSRSKISRSSSKSRSSRKKSRSRSKGSRLTSRERRRKIQKHFLLLKMLCDNRSILEGHRSHEEQIITKLYQKQEVLNAIGLMITAYNFLYMITISNLALVSSHYDDRLTTHEMFYFLGALLLEVLVFTLCALMTMYGGIRIRAVTFFTCVFAALSFVYQAVQVELTERGMPSEISRECGHQSEEVLNVAWCGMGWVIDYKMCILAFSGVAVHSLNSILVLVTWCRYSGSLEDFAFEQGVQQCAVLDSRPSVLGRRRRSKKSSECPKLSDVVSPNDRLISEHWKLVRGNIVNTKGEVTGHVVGDSGSLTTMQETPTQTIVRTTSLTSLTVCKDKVKNMDDTLHGTKITYQTDEQESERNTNTQKPRVRNNDWMLGPSEKKMPALESPIKSMARQDAGRDKQSYYAFL